MEGPHPRLQTVRVIFLPPYFCLNSGFLEQAFKAEMGTEKYPEGKAENILSLGKVRSTETGTALRRRTPQKALNDPNKGKSFGILSTRESQTPRQKDRS